MMLCSLPFEPTSATVEQEYNKLQYLFLIFIFYFPSTTMTSASSSKEIAAKIKALLKDIPRDERADAARLDELRQVLSSLVQQGDLTFSPSITHGSNNAVESATIKWNAWLQKQHKQTVTQLTSRMQKGRRTAVRTLWGLIAASPQVVTAHGHAQQHVVLPAELLYQWLLALVKMPMDVRQDKPLKHLVESEWTQRDVQYYGLRCMTRWATESYNNQKQLKDGKNGNDLTEQADRMLFLLMMTPFPTTQAALDMPDNKYLFPPPAGPSNRIGSYEDASDNDEDQDDNNSSDDEDDEEEDDDNHNHNEPPNKKQRRSAPKHFAYQDVKCHLSALAKAWLALLRLPLSTASLKKALPYLSQHVLPKIRNPLRFSDLFIKAYRGATGQDDSESSKRHANTIIPLVALDGLFYLMTQHQLEYPHFYAQLYALLKPKLFFVKYRQRFFELLQKCLLRNEMLPAHLVAAFLKRLLQCALKAPPAGTLFVLALCSNLLRGHEECAALIHRTALPDGDPYDPDTDDPVQSNALQSSLWELHALEKHYLTAVATLAQSIGQEDPKSPFLQLDEIAQQSYASLIAQERKRKGKKSSTPVTFTKPTALFSQDDVFAGILHVPSSTRTITGEDE
jgi:U3 small nucleolar RNA-associated protein 19